MIIACIPAYNEERMISDIIHRAKKFVDKVIVCDDGSSDNTVQNAKQAGAEVIQHQKNCGKGAAMKSLFKYAKQIDADITVTLDGDGQFLPEEIPKLIAPVIEKKSDIVIGFRFDDKTEMPSYRRIGNKLLDKVTNIAVDLPVRDSQSGFRAYSKKAVDMINFSTDGFGADSEILINAAKSGLIISEVKATVIYNTGGRTSTKNPVSHFTIVITSIIEQIALDHPLRYLGIPGIIFLIIGIIYSVIVITIFNDVRYFSIPSTLVAIGTLITGLMFLLMSVVLFAIGRILRRP
ncbi:MAG: glycosyltransferase family 2 protein [Nitrosarchaeum sp.]